MISSVDSVGSSREVNPSLAVDCINVNKWFGTNQVLRDVSFQAEDGETICIIGSSGAGKSTLLRCINQLEKYDSGRIYVYGALVGHRHEGDRIREVKESVKARDRRNIGMVFQNFNLFPHLTVLDNITLGPRRVHKMKLAEARSLAVELLGSVGLSDKLESYPRELSGGQQQRVGIARALAMRPRLLLFDEPTSALDPELVGEVLGIMTDIATQGGTTSIVVTHELEFAKAVADRIIFMQNGEIVEIGTPSQLVSNPKSERTKAYLDFSLRKDQ